jgi:hypothetical protein
MGGSSERIICKTRRTDMNNPPMRKNEFETQVHGGVKRVEGRRVTESREQKKRYSAHANVCPSLYTAVCKQIKIM